MGKTYTVSEVKAGANVDWYEDTVIPDPVEEYKPEPDPIVTKQAVSTQTQPTGSDRPWIDFMLRNHKYLKNSKGGMQYIELYKDPSTFYASDTYKNVHKKIVADKSGPYSTLNSAVDFVGSTMFPSVGGIMTAKKDVPDPVTGDSTSRMSGPLGFVHDLLMKNKYEALAKIKSAHLAGGMKIPKGFGGSFGQYNKEAFTDFGTVLRIGRRTFIRKPGDYNFYGNMSGMGLTTEQLHKIAALQDQKDPSEYDWRNPDSATKVLTYGGAGAYRLDGRHVDYMGRLAGSGTGQSDNFIHMADRYFNGNVAIARQWLEGTARFRTFTGYGQNKAAMIAHFETMVKKAGGDPNGGGIIVRGSGYFDKNGVFQSGSKPAEQTLLEKTNAYLLNPKNKKDYFEKYGKPLTVTAASNIVRGLPHDYKDSDGSNLGTGTVIQTDKDIDTATGKFSGSPPSTAQDMLDTVTSDVSDLNNMFNDIFPNETDWGTAEDMLYLKNNNDADAYVGNNLVDTWVKRTIDKINTSPKVDVQTQLDTFPADTGQLQVADIAQPQTSDDKPDNTGTTVGADFQKKDDEDFEKIREGTDTGFGGDYGFKEGGLVQDFWSEYNPVNMQFGGQPVENANIPTDPSGTVTGPMGFVDAPPSQVSERESVADDQATQLPEEAFVLNAPAVQLRGERDVKKMLMDAFMEAKSRGLPIGRVDAPLYEKNIDVLLSKGEVVIPPELVQIIGKGKLEKLNNRGKREVGERAKKLG